MQQKYLYSFADFYKTYLLCMCWVNPLTHEKGNTFFNYIVVLWSILFKGIFLFLKKSLKFTKTPASRDPSEIILIWCSSNISY